MVLLAEKDTFTTICCNQDLHHECIFKAATSNLLCPFCRKVNFIEDVFISKKTFKKGNYANFKKAYFNYQEEIETFTNTHPDLPLEFIPHPSTINKHYALTIAENEPSLNCQYDIDNEITSCVWCNNEEGEETCTLGCHHYHKSCRDRVFTIRRENDQSNYKRCIPACRGYLK